MSSNTYQIGSTSVVKIFELELSGFTATQLLPGFDPKLLQAHPSWVSNATYDQATGRVPLSVHTWLVRHQGKVILVDVGAGNDKTRPTMKMLDHLHEPFLSRLEAAGVRPEDVDVILLTHIHADHVGWNTSLIGEVWEPTFPNATVICSDLEWRYGAALTQEDEAGIEAARAEAGLGEPIRVPVAGVFADSMAPLEAAGKVCRVKVGGAEVLPGIRFLPMPGHSIDHAAIEIVSDGKTALFGGDVLHHPLEIYEPELVSMFCEFPDAARRSRHSLLSRAAETEALYFSSHFPESSAGVIGQDSTGYIWSFT
jgi:glyoxylase-like metal-dependent hydrolase (beta-lactamase superfamily II)